MTKPNGAQRKRRPSAGRVATALAVALVTAFTARIASASFGGSATVTQGSIAAGNITLTLANGDGAQAWTSMSISDLSPGIKRERTVDLTLGTAGFNTLRLVITSFCGTCHSNNALEGSDGILFFIERCDNAWTAVGTSPQTYTCGPGSVAVAGTSSAAPISILQIGGFLTTSGSLLSAGSVNRYKFSFLLPTDSFDTTRNQTGANAEIVSFTWTGTVRSGTSK